MDEYPEDWNPARDTRIPVWEACHHLCRALGESETAAGTLLARMPEKGEPVRQLAYRLYTQCERKGWAQEALPYNALVVAWPEIQRLAEEVRRATPVQSGFEL